MTAAETGGIPQDAQNFRAGDSAHAVRVTSPGIAQTDELNFDIFSRIPEYREVNRNLLRRLVAMLPDNFVHIDVASGTGLVPQEMILLCEEELGKKGRIIGVEPDHRAVEKARERTPASKCVEVEYVEGYGQDLEVLLAGRLPEQGADSASIHDAIHEIPGRETKKTVVQAIYARLKKEGPFSMNSAFTNKGMAEAAMKYGKWAVKGHQILGLKPGKSGIEVLPTEDYDQILKDAGFKIIHRAEVPVIMSREALEGIAQYPPFVKGIFTDVDDQNISLKQQSDALIHALDKLDIMSLPRIWYELIAQKPLGKAA